MSQGRTPAGNLNAYFSILKKLMNTASMAKHFNQPLPAVPTFKKKKKKRRRREGLGGGNAQVYQKSFFERSTVLLAVYWAMGGQGGKSRRNQGRRVPVPSAKRCALASVFVEQIKHVLVFHLLK